MYQKTTLDLSSIRVVSFETVADERPVVEAHLASRHTANPCCVDTICVTLIECSTERCA